MQSFLIAETDKSFEVACTDLESAVASHHFGLIGVHDPGETEAFLTAIIEAAEAASPSGAGGCCCDEI
jgi:hypothetical protein